MQQESGPQVTLEGQSALSEAEAKSVKSEATISPPFDQSWVVTDPPESG